MRWIRLIGALLSAHLKRKIAANETATLKFYVWLTDIDVSMMNHAAILTVMEAGRIDFMVRTNFLRMAIKKKWTFPAQALSVQFYKPLKLFQKCELQTKIYGVDEKWIYLIQRIVRTGEVLSACLVKVKIKKGRITVPTSHVISSLSLESISWDKPSLIENYEVHHNQMNEIVLKRW